MFAVMATRATTTIGATIGAKSATVRSRRAGRGRGRVVVVRADGEADGEADGLLKSQCAELERLGVGSIGIKVVID